MKSELPNWATCERIFAAPHGAVPIIKRKPASDSGRYLDVRYRVHSTKVKSGSWFRPRRMLLRPLNASANEQVANQRLPLCPGCGRKLTTEQQSYRGLVFHDLRRTAAAGRSFRGRNQKNRQLENHRDVSSLCHHGPTHAGRRYPQAETLSHRTNCRPR